MRGSPALNCSVCRKGACCVGQGTLVQVSSMRRTRPSSLSSLNWPGDDVKDLFINSLRCPDNRCTVPKLLQRTHQPSLTNDFRRSAGPQRKRFGKQVDGAVVPHCSCLKCERSVLFPSYCMPRVLRRRWKEKHRLFKVKNELHVLCRAIHSLLERPALRARFVLFLECFKSTRYHHHLIWMI